MTRQLARRLLYNVFLKINTNALRNLKMLQRWQWLKPETAKELQNKRLVQLLSHAYRNVPYYYEVLSDAGVVSNSGEIRLNNFTQIPLLNKKILRERFNDLKSRDLNKRKWYYNTSGGSTGEPARFIQDKKHNNWGRAIKIFYDMWTDYLIGEPKVLPMGFRM